MLKPVVPADEKASGNRCSRLLLPMLLSMLSNGCRAQERASKMIVMTDDAPSCVKFSTIELTLVEHTWVRVSLDSIRSLLLHLLLVQVLFMFYFLGGRAKINPKQAARPPASFCFLNVLFKLVLPTRVL